MSSEENIARRRGTQKSIQEAQRAGRVKNYTRRAKQPGAIVLHRVLRSVGLLAAHGPGEAARGGVTSTVCSEGQARRSAATTSGVTCCGWGWGWG